MLKENKSIKVLITESFYLNSYVGNAVLVGIVATISVWFLWADQKIGCNTVLSIYNQYSNSISRELALENSKVAIANFSAFQNELNGLGVINNLTLNISQSADSQNIFIEKCKVSILSSKLNLPLSFSGRINGTINGSISNFRSLIALSILWIITIFLILTLNRIKSKVNFRLEKEIIDPIKSLSIGNFIEDKYLYPIEVIDINNNIIALREKIVANEKLASEILLAQRMNELTSQVSHDIRSPLSALNLMINHLSQIPEDSRTIIRSAVSRINDIANQLLLKSKELKCFSFQTEFEKNDFHNSGRLSKQLLSPLIDEIISEKRAQFREKENVQIEADLSQSYGIFVMINKIEIKRIFSNLVNNSIEAFPHESGKVLITVKCDCDKVSIAFKDNGKGIPSFILSKLGEKGVSHGKMGTQSGNGLGIYHAKKFVEDIGGIFHVESQENIGTTVTILLDRAHDPKWFVSKLQYSPGMIVVSLDDDISIHQIWKDRFEKKNMTKFPLKHVIFTSGLDFKSWVTSQAQHANLDVLYLVDYELLNQRMTGLDIIDELGIDKNSILVTSRYEEECLLDRCERLGIKIIPKMMAGYVPIEMSL